MPKSIDLTSADENAKGRRGRHGSTMTNWISTPELRLNAAAFCRAGQGAVACRSAGLAGRSPDRGTGVDLDVECRQAVEIDAGSRDHQVAATLMNPPHTLNTRPVTSLAAQLPSHTTSASTRTCIARGEVDFTA
ncbi:MAG: hypothetical protein LC797_01600 [Chloroflexi bacterium]|nr:hypothetical protein [Chloroflexota bacterium]